MRITNFPSKPTCKESLELYLRNLMHAPIRGIRSPFYLINTVNDLLEEMQHNTVEEMVRVYRVLRASSKYSTKFPHSRNCLDIVILKMLKSVGAKELEKTIRASIELSK